jgi:rSAM/selenodomain-associated transferase 1
MKKALIVFAKQPLPGRVKTRLTPFLTPVEAADIYRCMLLDTLNKVQKLERIDRFLFYEAGDDAAAYFQTAATGMEAFPQRGSDLGERMSDAFQQTLACGYDVAAIIGTDSPDIPVAYLEEAFRRLEDEKVDAIFGPSEDGGYYLIAMRKLHIELFQNVPWSSREVRRKSLENAEQASLKVSLLPTWHDLDTVDDLHRPELLDAENGAPRTREFIGDWLKGRG